MDILRKIYKKSFVLFIYSLNKGLSVKIRQQ